MEVEDGLFFDLLFPFHFSHLLFHFFSFFLFFLFIVRMAAVKIAGGHFLGLL